MYYIKQEENELIKYEVKINIEKLNQLKIEIIDNCAEITHQCYESSNFPNWTDTLHIRNYSSNFIRTHNYNNWHTQSEDIYRFEYDEYKDPFLVTIIDQLLSGNASVISDLDNPIIKKEKPNDEYENLIRQATDLLEYFISIQDQKQIEKLEKIIKDLKKAKEHIKINLDRKSDIEYYQQVKECISLKKIGKIKVSTVDEVNSFFEDISPKNIDKTICTNKKMIKIIK